jgi:phosphoserine phosphatase
MPRAQCVIFDCDSTLTAIEGIDVLAAEHREEVARLTNQAMDGRVPLERVYAERLALVRPSRTAVEALGQDYIRNLVPHAREVVRLLIIEGIEVRIISGGLEPAVFALAAELGVDQDNVAAVGIRFADDGSYEGFDTTALLAASRGKLQQVKRWGKSLPRPVILVGDGITDLEARPAVDMFVAYAGVAERPAVVAGADAVIVTESLLPLLLIVFDDEPPASEAGKRLFDEALRLLQPPGIPG